MIVSIDGTDMVLVSARYPWRERTGALLRKARRDPHIAMGLDLYNAMANRNPAVAMVGLVTYNNAVSYGGACGRRIAGTVREAARCQIAATQDDGEPAYVGFSINRLKPPKKIRAAATKLSKAAYKASRSKALPMVAAAIPGVGPGVASGIVAYQGAMTAYDLAKAGKGAEALDAITAVASEATRGDPRAQAALANIRKGAAIVKDVQQLGKASPAEVAKLIADRAGVDVMAIAKSYGLPSSAITSDAISKLAQGKLPMPVARSTIKLLRDRGVSPTSANVSMLLRGASQISKAPGLPGVARPQPSSNLLSLPGKIRPMPAALQAVSTLVAPIPASASVSGFACPCCNRPCRNR